MSKELAKRALHRAIKLVEGIGDEEVDRRKYVVRAAQEDLRLWTVFAKERETMRRAALIGAGWDFQQYGNTGECGGFASKWLQAGLVFVPTMKYIHDVPFGAFCGQIERTATPVALLDAFRHWQRFIPGTAAALKDVGPGDLVVFNEGKNGHAGIVEQVNSDGTFGTIEANNENRIRRVTRSLEKVLGFGSIG